VVGDGQEPFRVETLDYDLGGLVAVKVFLHEPLFSGGLVEFTYSRLWYVERTARAVRA
jgi:hypothetical protein